MASINPAVSSVPGAAHSARPAPIVALVSRTLLFAGFQALMALFLAMAGQAAPWAASSAWWVMSATLTNLVCIGLLVYWMRQEGARYWDLFRADRTHWKRDLLSVLGLVIALLPLAIVPNIVLAGVLFGDAQAAVTLLFRPLPLWAVWTGIVLFPVTIALAELPLYFGYVMPRLGQGWRAVLLPTIFLSLQHAALPLICDWRFIVWRATMFGLFALALGFVLRRRPRLLPYLVVVHGLLDLQTALMFLSLR